MKIREQNHRQEEVKILAVHQPKISGGKAVFCDLRF